MNFYLRPLWAILANTLPLLVLFFLQYTVFGGIKSELTPQAIHLWQGLGIVIIILMIYHTALGSIKLYQKRPLPLSNSVVTLVSYLGLLITYLSFEHTLIPWSIPDWLLPGERKVYAGTFLMPGLLHALMAMVVQLTPIPKEVSTWKNTLWIILIPGLCYLLITIVLPLVLTGQSRFEEMAFISSIILGAVGFLFFIARMVYIGYSKGRKITQLSRAGLLILGLAAPLFALYLHDYFESPIGNFASSAYYILAGLNGLILILPFRSKTPYGQGIILFVRATSVPFILYFFLVFAPYTPLSFLMILFYGVGLLMLVPVFLFPIQLQQFATTWNESQTLLGRWKSLIILLVGLSAIPTAIIWHYQQHRNTLHAALQYLYHAPLEANYRPDISTSHLSSILEAVNEQAPTSSRNSFSTDQSTPLLSWFYRWLVLDNLTLSTQKRDRLQRVFLGENSPTSSWSAPLQDQTIQGTLNNITTRSTYSQELHLFQTWVDMKVENHQSSNQEFRTHFDLPDGAFITDYYLDMPWGRDYGILAEKKAAMWVYRQIVNRTRQDPGLIYYQNNSTIGLRVFPVPPDSSRTTGFLVTHVEPITLNIHGKSILLGSDRPDQPEEITSPDGFSKYLSASKKAELPLVTRQPYAHFILAGGAADENNVAEMIRLVKSVLTLLPDRLQKTAKYTVVGTYPTHGVSGESIENVVGKHSFVGAPFWERAILEIAYPHTVNPQEYYPTPILVGADAFTRLEPSPLWKSIPEVSQGFTILSGGKTKAWPIEQGGTLRTTDSPLAWIKALTTSESHSLPQVHAYPNAAAPKQFLPQDGFPGLILSASREYPTATPEGATTHLWEAGLLGTAQQWHRVVFPEQAQSRWLDLLKTSFQHRVLNPATAFMVLETEAQKEALLRKQAQTLSGKEYLDADTENLTQMSEPGLWIIFLGGGLWWYFRRRMKN